MCDTCGCNVTPGNEHLVAAGGHLAKTSGGNESVEVLKGLLDANDHQAAHNREHFARHNALAVNLMSSPGAGKTALLEATADAFGDEFKFAVIEGDLETENDAERIRQKGVPAVQISTGSACHLDAHMVHSALHELDIDVLSTPEGHDKPAKYPVMFRAADLVLVTKADLLPVLDDFDPAYAEDCLRNLANTAPFMIVSARKGDGMDAWLDWLRAQLVALRSRDAVVGAD
jgi:hydrogenase nickel incorporation protein HypB